MARVKIVRKDIDTGEWGVEEAVTLEDAFRAVEKLEETESALHTVKATLAKREAELKETRCRLGRVHALAVQAVNDGPEATIPAGAAAFFPALRDFLAHGDNEVSRSLPGVTYVEKWGFEFPPDDQGEY